MDHPDLVLYIFMESSIDLYRVKAHLYLFLIPTSELQDLLPKYLFFRYYPDFYTKLYALFETSVFHVKYRSRFFHLADLFLSST